MPETIYDALHESHERQRSLCRRLLRAKRNREPRHQHGKTEPAHLLLHLASTAIRGQ